MSEGDKSLVLDPAPPGSRIRLGSLYADRVTGFKGVATARTEHWTRGPNEILLESRDLAEGHAAREWFDENRLVGFSGGDEGEPPPEGH